MFLLVHPLDRIVVELTREAPFLGPHLPEPKADLSEIDTVWVFWHPAHLAVWSASTHEWTSLLLAPMEGADSGQEPTLIRAELAFLDEIGWREGSPFLWGFGGSDGASGGT